MDHEDRVYRTAKEKWESIIEEIKANSDAGRPVLVGTTSVEKSEMLSGMLKRKYGIEHEVLNAKQHEREALIIAKAGQQHTNHHGNNVGNVTIATNMAGRGTDIAHARDRRTSAGSTSSGPSGTRPADRQPDSRPWWTARRSRIVALLRLASRRPDEAFAGEWTIKVLYSSA
jgi:preprotein translocase subunit SecA